MHVLQSRLLLEDPAGAAIAAQVFAPRFRPRAVGLLPGDLAPTGVAAATYGDGTHVAQVAVGVDGRVASAANVAITGEDAGLNLAHAAFLPRRALPLVPTGVTPGTYGDGSHVAQVTIGADGRTTAASSVAITGAAPTGGAGGILTGTYPSPGLAATIPQAESVVLTDATNNTVSTVLTIGHLTTSGGGASAAGFGSKLLWTLDDNGAAVDNAADFSVSWVSAVGGSQKARVVLNAWDTAAREFLRGEASGSAAKIGFLGATAAAQQTGDAGTALVTFGLMSGTPTFNAANLTAVPNSICAGRLTLQSAAAVQTADQTAATTLYYDPYTGNSIALPWSGVWTPYTFGEQSLKLTDSAQTCHTQNATKVITSLTDTSQLVRGMLVTGTNIGAAAVISSIDSATQVTLSVNSTATASGVALTFKLPASTNYDVYAVPTSTSAFRLQLGNAWTNATTRADAVTQAGALNGVLVNNAAINAADSNTIAAQAGRYLGTIQTTATAGQSESSLLNRFVYNFYNKEPLAMEVTDATSHTYGTNTTRQWRAQAANQLNFILGQPQDLQPTVAADLQPPLGDYGVYGLTLDSTSTEDVVAVSQGASSSTNQFDAGVSRVRHVGIGQHYVAATQRAVSGSVTFGSLKLGMLLLG